VRKRLHLLLCFRFTKPLTISSQLCSRRKHGVCRPVFHGAYYLLGDLAMMERQLMLSASKLLRSCDFRHIVCPDSVKSHILVRAQFLMGVFVNIVCDHHCCCFESAFTTVWFYFSVVSVYYY